MIGQAPPRTHHQMGARIRQERVGEFPHGENATREFRRDSKARQESDAQSRHDEMIEHVDGRCFQQRSQRKTLICGNPRHQLGNAMALAQQCARQASAISEFQLFFLQQRMIWLRDKAQGLP